MNKTSAYSQLNLIQKIFFRYFCYPPPGKDIAKTENIVDIDLLASWKQLFGKEFQDSINGKIVLDVGCGKGDQAIGFALEGAKYSIGLEIRQIYENNVKRAEELGISEKVKFDTCPIKDLGESTVDIAFSHDSFEHFADPDKILEDVRYVLKPNGKFFVTFGPPWFNPYGVHMFMMLKYPWMHFLFSERTIMTVRKLYKDDNANRYEEIDGGLNKMTVAKFEKSVKLAGFQLEKLSLTPIKGMSPLTRYPIVREFFTSIVSAILVK